MNVTSDDCRCDQQNIICTMYTIDYIFKINLKRIIFVTTVCLCTLPEKLPTFECIVPFHANFGQLYTPILK